MPKAWLDMLTQNYRCSLIYEVLIWVLLKMKSKYPDGLQQKEMLYLSKVIRTTVSLRRGEQRINHSAIRMPRKKDQSRKNCIHHWSFQSLLYTLPTTALRIMPSHCERTSLIIAKTLLNEYRHHIP